MLWKFNPNQERSAFFNTIWTQYAYFANNQDKIAKIGIQAFCNTLGEATLKLAFAAEAAIDANTLSPIEIDSIYKTITAMSNFHHDYHSKETISDPVKLIHDLSVLGEQMAEGTTLGWEFKLSRKFPQVSPEAPAIFERNHARNGAKPR